MFYRIDRSFPSNYYPGYNCKYEKKPGICAYGGKYCNNRGVCEGGTLNDHCQRHSDCYFDYYCNQYGRCVPSRDENETCTINEACKRGYLCYFPETSSFYGKCTKIMSLETDTAVLPEYNRVVYEQEGMEKLCKSGWYNRTTGKCFAGVKSSQKGSVCSTDLDWPTTVADIFAQWKWGFGTKGQKYCDIEGDDDEWIDVRNKFTNYSDTFDNCHQAEGFGEWFYNDHFVDWKCAELRARLYVYFIDLPDCWNDIKHQHPIFAEWAYYCRSWYTQIMTTLLLASIAWVLVGFVDV